MSRGQTRQQCSYLAVAFGTKFGCCLTPDAGWVASYDLLLRFFFGTGATITVLAPLSSAVVRKVIDHAATLVPTPKPNMVADPDVSWMGSSAVLLVAGCLLCFIFHLCRDVLFPSLSPNDVSLFFLSIHRFVFLCCCCAGV